jgi:hypothetical protein
MLRAREPLFLSDTDGCGHLLLLDTSLYITHGWDLVAVIVCDAGCGEVVLWIPKMLRQSEALFLWILKMLRESTSIVRY